MHWTSGHWSSYPDDGRAFIERDVRGWWVYATDEEGRVLAREPDADEPLVFAPPLHDHPFPTLVEAQGWVEMNVTARLD